MGQQLCTEALLGGQGTKTDPLPLRVLRASGTAIESEGIPKSIMRKLSLVTGVLRSLCRGVTAILQSRPSRSVCLALLLQSAGMAATATPAFVQEKDNQANSSTTSRVTFASSSTAGNLIVVYLIWDSTGSAAVSDSLGNVYASVTAPVRWSGGKYSTQIFYAINRAQGVDAVTATFATRLRSFGIIYAHEYSGISQTAPLDTSVAAVGTGGSLGSGPAATSNAMDLLFAGGVSANTVTSAGPGYAARSYAQGNITEDRVVSATGTYSATASNSGGGWEIQMVAFKAQPTAAPADTIPPSVPTGLTATSISVSQINLSWAASTDLGSAPSQITYGVYRNGVRVATTAAGVISWADTGLAASTTYSYSVCALDAAGNSSAQSTPVSATTAAPTPTPDTQSPTVTITAPANNQNVSGVTTITANASDNVGVVGVQFQVDGGSLGTEITTAPYSTSWDTSRTTTGAHLLTAIARDAAGNHTVSGTVAVTVSTASTRLYTTSFPNTENPISEGGNWTNGLTNGLDWADVRTTPGLAFGTDVVGYGDSTAIVSGSWGPDQMVQATVHSVNPTDNLFEEVELRLRSTVTAHSNTGYEINFRCLKDNNAYSQIVRWNGPLANFTYLSSLGGAQYGVTDGDVVKATMIGNVITTYINGVQIAQVTDNTYKTGSPGMGFYLQGLSDYGFTSFTASDGLGGGDTVPPTTPLNLAANIGSPSEIDLTWDASSDNVGVAGYQVFRNNLQIATTTSAKFSDKTVVPGISYTYAVAAFDAAGNTSPQSSPAVAASSPAVDVTPPSIPSGLQAASISATSVKLSWSASTDDVAVAGYQIFRNGAQVGTSNAANYVDTGLAALTSYSYTVAAYDGSNNVSAPSQALIVNTTPPAATPPSFVQGNRDQISYGTSTSVPFNSPTLAGNTIVVYVIWSNTAAITVTDTRNDTFVSAGPPVSWGSGDSAQVFYATNVAGGPDTVTASFKTAVNSFGVVYIHEYAGISPTNPVDVTASASGASATLNSGAATTTSPNDLIFAAGVSDNTVTSGGSGFAVRDLAYGNITEDRVAASVASYTATATHVGNQWGMQMVAFRAAQ